ncbi:uncharacterized protein LOC134767742 [Penaeus indicus]|uniref:uncharacterized protein LOC134767742 n=1 Tax=Penaeus indicus TaxID=29960 RepID=UPI00300D21D1
MNVNDSGARHTIEVDDMTTVIDLKREIVSKGISERVALIVHKDWHLCSLSAFRVTLARDSGFVIKMVFHEESSVCQIKEEAARDVGVRASKVQLFVGGAEMQDDRRLKDYGITGDAVVWMEVEGEEEGRAGGSQRREAGCCSICSVM